MSIRSDVDSFEEDFEDAKSTISNYNHDDAKNSIDDVKCDEKENVFAKDNIVLSPQTTLSPVINAPNTPPKLLETNSPSSVEFRAQSIVSSQPSIDEVNGSRAFVSIELDDEDSVQKESPLQPHNNQQDSKWNWRPTSIFNRRDSKEIKPELPRERQVLLSMQQQQLNAQISQQKEPKIYESAVQEDDMIAVENLVMASRSSQSSESGQSKQQNANKKRNSTFVIPGQTSQDILAEMSMNDLVAERERILGRIQMLSTALVDHLEARELIMQQNVEFKAHIAKLLDKLGRKGQVKKLSLNSYYLKQKDQTR